MTRTVGPCDWLVERWRDDFDGGRKVIVECGADAVFDDRGWECAAGHSHVVAEVRAAEGGGYAEDEGEASRLGSAGVEPRDVATDRPFT